MGLKRYTQDHTGIPDDIIYRIECNGKVYIGQSKDGFNRIRTHLTSAYRHLNTISDSTGAAVLYQEINRTGLCNTNVTVYSAPNYGLMPEDFITFFTMLIPANQPASDWHAENATQDQRRDAAEIIHILHEYALHGNALTNTSMGGQGTSYRFLTKNYGAIKLLTRQMSPGDALKLIGASDVSKKNLLNTFNRIRTTLFSKDWSPDNKIISQLNLSDGEKTILKESWQTFAEKELQPLFNQVTLRFNGKSITYIFPQAFTDKLDQFQSGREKYIKELWRSLSSELTRDERKLAEDNNAKLFTAHLDFKPLCEYITHVIENNAAQAYKQNKSKGFNIDIEKLKKFTGPIAVNTLFNISTLQSKTEMTTFIYSVSPTGTTVSPKLLQGFSYSTFQYFYQQETTLQIGQEPFYYYDSSTDALITTASAQMNYGFQIEGNTYSSYRQVGPNNWLSTRLRNRIGKRIQFVNQNWYQYFAGMMHILRHVQFESSAWSLDLVDAENDRWITTENESGLRYMYHRDIYNKYMQEISSVEELVVY